MCFAPQQRALFRHLNFQKWSETISFLHFWLGMCFAPQQRALFRHLNFQKWSETVSFLHFWLGNVLRATTACTFSTSQLPKVVWDRQFFTLLTWKCASRHNSVHLFDISTSKMVWDGQSFTLLTWKCASRHDSVHFFDISTSKSGLRPSVFYTFDLEMCFAPQQRALSRHLNIKKWSETVSLLRFWLGNVLRATTACTFSTSQLPTVVWDRQLLTSSLGNVLRATTACTFSTSQLPKVVWDRQFFTLLTWKCASRHNSVHLFDISTSKMVWDGQSFTLLTWKCASRHNSVHFFDIWTSKSGLRPSVFYTFDLEMCFAPQQRALFRHLNVKKWPEHGMFFHILLGNVLRAKTACTFSTSQLSKVIRCWCALYIFTWKCDSCHNGVQFFISHLASWLTRRFSEPTFHEPQIVGKTQWLATFLPFRAPASSCFSLFLFSDLLTSWLLLPDSSRLCFSISPYCRKFDF